MYYRVTTALNGSHFSTTDTEEVNSYIKAFRIAERWLKADNTKEAVIYAIYEDDEDLENCENIHKWASADIRDMQTTMAHLVFDEDTGGVTDA